MLIPSFPATRCINGHYTPYFELECRTCGEKFDDPKHKAINHCHKCSMLRPIISDPEFPESAYRTSKFCFWCGVSFAIDPLNPL